MKRFSQTLRISLALLLAMFGTSALPTAVVYATAEADTELSQTQTEVKPETTEEPATVADPGLPVVDGDLSASSAMTAPTTSSKDDATAPVVPETQDANQLPADNTQLLSQRMSQPEQPSQAAAVAGVPPQELEFNDMCGVSGDTYTIPTTPGVTYWLRVNSWLNLPLTSGVKSTLGEDDVTIYARVNGQTAQTYNLEFKTKCNICHATSSKTNPYTQNDLSESAILTQGHRGHTGPVYPAAGWGDIIPPTGLHPAGLNWSAEGQAIYNNDCNVPVTLEVTPSTACVNVGEKTGSLTIWVYGTSSGSKLRVNGNTVENLNNGTAMPVEVTGLGGGDYTVTVIKDTDTLASTTVTIETCLIETTPTAPYDKDFCYTDRDGIFIGYTKGVKYYVDGKKVRGWAWVPFTGEPIEVTAEAREGYEIPEGVTASWEYTAEDFTNEKCLTVTKKAVYATDTNLDALIGLGDTVTWEITVTNTSDEDYEAFKVLVDDPNAVLEGNGYIKYLGAGKTKTLTATSTITTSDLEACKVVNTANFSGWRIGFVHHDNNNNDARRMTSPEREGGWTKPDPIATGSSIPAVYNLVCPEVEEEPEPGVVLGTQAPTAPQVLATSTALPEVLPATGGGSDTNYTLLGIVLSAAAYYFAYRRQSAEA